MACILFDTFGTDGDILPFIQIGRQLIQQDNKVAIITHSYFEKKIRQANIDFIPSDTIDEYKQLINDTTMIVSPKGNIEFLKRNIPNILPAYEKIKEYYIPNQTVIFGNLYGILSTIIAEKLDIPKIGIYLAEGFVLPERNVAFIYDYLKEDINKIRAKLGLNSPYNYRLFMQSAKKYIGLWPEWFYAEHLHGHENIEKIGFFVNWNQTEALPDEVVNLLNNEDKPILIYSGSNHAFVNSDFLNSTVKACEVLGQHAIFVARHNKKVIPDNLPKEIHVFDQLDFATLMPKVKFIIHHGGIGTVAQALASGLPQLILGGGLDRPSNGRSVNKLGVGEYLLPSQWKYENILSKLYTVTSQSVAENCSKISERMKKENPIEKLNTIINSVLKDYQTNSISNNLHDDRTVSVCKKEVKENEISKINELDNLVNNLSQEELESLLKSLINQERKETVWNHKSS